MFLSARSSAETPAACSADPEAVTPEREPTAPLNGTAQREGGSADDRAQGRSLRDSPSTAERHGLSQSLISAPRRSGAEGEGADGRSWCKSPPGGIEERDDPSGLIHDLFGSWGRGGARPCTTERRPVREARPSPADRGNRDDPPVPDRVRSDPIRSTPRGGVGNGTIRRPWHDRRWRRSSNLARRAPPFEAAFVISGRSRPPNGS